GRLAARLGGGGLPLDRRHAGGVAPERGDADATEPLLAGLVAQPAAELDCVSIADSGRLEDGLQGRAVELRIPPRRRKPPDIDERPDARFAQTFDELADGTPAMPDRQNLHANKMPPSVAKGKAM